MRPVLTKLNPGPDYRKRLSTAELPEWRPKAPPICLSDDAHHACRAGELVQQVLIRCQTRRNGGDGLREGAASNNEIPDGKGNSALGVHGASKPSIAMPKIFVNTTLSGSPNAFRNMLVAARANTRCGSAGSPAHVRTTCEWASLQHMLLRSLR